MKIKEFLRRKWWIILAIILIILIILVVIIIIRKYHPTGIKNVRIADPKEFYTSTSINGKDCDTGRCNNGDLMKNGKIVEKGLQTVDDLNQYPLTYAAGHPYYDSQNPSSDNGWGYLRKNSWDEYVTEIATPLRHMKSQPSSSETLVIEKNTRVYLDYDLNVEGLVVRHGGILLIKSPKKGNIITIKAQYIIIESGGLLQTGSSYNDKFRFNLDSKLEIRLQSSAAGYSKMAVAASQYTYKVYAPGVDNDTGPAKFTNYAGSPMPFNNSFGGPKTVGVGFNGNLQLCAAISSSVPYTGTWSANANGTEFIGKNELFTTNAPDIEQSYPNTWTKLEAGSGTKNSNQIQLDSSAKNHLETWKPGSQIVITCSTKNYNGGVEYTEQAPIPIWLDHKDETQRSANESANNTLSSRKVDMSRGVEVATIKSIDKDKGIIYLVSPLKFDHGSEYTNITRTRGNPKSIQVDTRVHVGLLTRNILLTSDFNSAVVAGCNVLMKDANMHQMTIAGITNQSAHRIMTSRMRSLQIGIDKETKEMYEQEFSGPGGAVICNYASSGTMENASPSLSMTKCYTTPPRNSNLCSGLPTPGKDLKGHWIFGTEGMQGCNAIHGGQTLFRYGSSVRLDGIEIKYMGTAPNFGSIARYSVHFHLSGYAKSFRGYLLDEKYSRDGHVVNTANWCCFNRWTVTHGSHEICVRNNIGFIGFGSSYFVEDGTETYNIFEHNLGISTLPAREDSYYNPTPIYGNIAADTCWASTFWFKNNQNSCLRNVATCSPTPVMGIWIAVQFTSRMRGPSSVCIGDPVLKLPALATPDNASAWDSSALSQAGNKSTMSPVCWSIDDYKLKNLIDSKNCASFTNNNFQNPYFLWCENVFYNIASAISEQLDIRFETGNPGCRGSMVPKNQYIPINGENSCLDQPPLGQANYPQPIWGGSTSNTYTYQPINQSELSTLTTTNATHMYTSGINSIPKMFCNWLTWNMGPNNADNFGAGWTHLGACWLFNCCFLQKGGGTYQLGSRSSSKFDFTNGNAVEKWGRVYHIYYNQITDGWLNLPPNPMIIAGSKTFITDKSVPAPAEYADNPNYAVCEYYFGDGIDHTIIPDTFWNQVYANEDIKKSGADIMKGVVVTLLDDDGNKYTQSSKGLPVSSGAWSKTSLRKFPYVCGDDGGLFQDTTSEYVKANPTWKYVINSHTGIFTNDYGIGIGNKMCKMLSYITPKRT
jgi:hypothetical protein